MLTRPAGGFDTANPPYVPQEEITPKAYKDVLLKAYADSAVDRSDWYCYFYTRCLQPLKEGRIRLFVCSNSWLDMATAPSCRNTCRKHRR